jgi:predicted dehydrogenase
MSRPITRRTFAAAGALTAASAMRVAGANDRIRLGIVGAGGRGGNHITDITKLKDLNVTISGVCDVWRVNREKSAAIVARNFGAAPRTTTDYREMVQWNDIDAVVIATPDFSHPIILEAAVKAGKDAYVEKPFGTTFAEVKSAYLAVKRSDRVVQVGTQRRSDGNYMGAAKEVLSGALGKVTRVEFAMAVQAPRWKRKAESVDPNDVDWKVFQMGRIERGFDARLLREWQLFDGETTNGIPGLWMSHYIDLVAWYMNDPYPLGVVSNGGVYLWKDGRKTSDVFFSLLEYPTEFMVMFTMSLTNSAGIRDLWYGTRGLLDCEKWMISGEGSEMPDKIAAPAKIVPEVTNHHMHNFLECVRSRQKPRADVNAGFSHAVAGIMSSEALAKGRRMRFDTARLEIV